MQKKLQTVLSLLEDSIRGRSIDGTILCGLAKELHSNFTSRDCEIASASLTDDAKVAIVNTAVNLHNKLRMAKLDKFREAKAYLKSTSAWMLTLYGQQTLKVSCTCIQLLLRSAQDLLEINDEDLHNEESLRNLDRALSLWTKINNNPLERSLAPLNLEELRLSVFHAYINKVKLYQKLSRLSHGVRDVRLCISACRELLLIFPQVVVQNVIFSFIKSNMDLAYDFASNPQMMSEAAHYYRVALDTIDMALKGISSNSVNNQGSSKNFNPKAIEGIELKNDSSESELQLLRIKTSLSLSYTLKELKEYDKAMYCLKHIEDQKLLLERTPDSIHLIQLAKFMIYCDSGALELADETLQLLLKPATSTQYTACSYEISLNSILKFIKVVSSSQRETSESDHILELFRMLLIQYPNEPEFTNTRVQHLRYLLTTIVNQDSSTSKKGNNPLSEEGSCDKPIQQRALELCRVILDDHTERDRPLSPHNFEVMKHLLVERVRWHRAMAEWKEAGDWVVLLLKLLPEDETGDRVTGLLWHADALFHLGDHQKALAISIQSNSLMKSPRTIAMVFRCAIDVYDPRESVDQIIKFLNTKTAGGSNSHTDGSDSMMSFKFHQYKSLEEDNTLDNQISILDMIIVCYKVAMESHSRNRNDAMTLLLEEWTQIFLTCRAWRFIANMHDENLNRAGVNIDNDQFPNAALKSPSFFQVIIKLIHTFIENHLKRTDQMSNNPILEYQPSFLMNVYNKGNESGEFVGHNEASVKERSMTPMDTQPQVLEMGSDVNDENNPPNQQHHQFQGNASVDSDDFNGNSAPIASDSSAPSPLLSQPIRLLPSASSPLSSSSLLGDALVSLGKRKGDEIPLGENQPVRRSQNSSLDDFEHAFKTTAEGYVAEENMSTAPVRDQLESFSKNNYHMFSNDANNQHYVMTCPLAHLESDVLVRVEKIVTLLKELCDDGYPVEALGDPVDQDWIAGIAWNLGCLLMKHDLCEIDQRKDFSDATKDLNDSPKNKLAESHQRLTLAARFMEAAEGIYARLTGSTEAVNNENRTFAMIVATALRLDSIGLYSELLGFESADLGDKTSGEYDELVTSILDKSSNNLVKANQILRKQIGFDDERGRQLRKIVLVFEFTVLCRRPEASPKKLEDFLEHNQSRFLDLNALELQKCASIAEGAPGSNPMVVRQILAHAIQVCSREHNQDYGLTGELYSKVIALSPSRQQALDRIEEFEQLLKTTETSFMQLPKDATTAVPRFNKGDINRIFSICYNSGIMTMELGQVDIAEKFLSRALSLISYCSIDTQSSWGRTCQDAYEKVLTAKTKSNSANTKGGYLFETLVSGTSPGPSMSMMPSSSGQQIREPLLSLSTVVNANK